MDAHGAQTLHARLEQQEHWRQAEAVRRGDQPSTDPDAWELEDLGDGIRLYSVREEARRTVDGRSALVVKRLTKRLDGDRWQTAYEVERVRPL